MLQRVPLKSKLRLRKVESLSAISAMCFVLRDCAYFETLTLLAGKPYKREI